MGLVFIAAIMGLSLCGCATMTKKCDQQNVELKNQVMTLEQQLQQKDVEIEGLRKALTDTTEDRYTAAKLQALPEKPSIKQIQLALKNAGFQPGPVDGRMGTATRKAIKDFQKANDLEADGKVGKRTWAALGAYLYNKKE
jgi:peptidoglycan hydrolase-like protein with peptidoglycan-binding domain